jgi:sugar/nucleoside kinase (ribokinase family)
MRAPGVAGLGESSVDFVYVTERLPGQQSSKSRIQSHYSTCGGQVATTMAACAALGLHASFLGPIGDDDNGRRLRQELADRGVDVSRTIVRPAPNRYAIIVVDGSTGERTVLWERDPRLDIPPERLGEPHIAGARIVHVDGTDEAASIALARTARAAGLTVTCDIDTVTPRTGELLSHVTIPILGEHVPQQLTGTTDIEVAMRAVRGPHHDLFCVTLGSRGAALLDGERFLQAPSTSVAAVDTTGAGDVFRGGFIYGLLQGWPSHRTLQFANAAAASSCTRRGAIPSVPDRLEVERHLR